MSNIAEEQNTDGNLTNISKTYSFRLLYIFEITLTMLSSLVIGYNALYFPSNYDWIPILSNFGMGLVFLGVLFFGFVASTYSTIRIDRRVDEKQSVSVSKITALLLSAPSLFIVNLALGVFFTLALNGPISSIILGVFTFYGYGIGALVFQAIAKYLGLRRWELLQNGTTGEIILSTQI